MCARVTMAMRALPTVLPLVGLLLSGCTTYGRPVTCEPGSSGCGGIHDARFCEYQALAIRGSDCPSLEIGPAKPFCVVTTQACIDTNYSVKDRDCEVLRYERLIDSGRDDCPPGVPIFLNR